jgi:hypothetical protein
VAQHLAVNPFAKEARKCKSNLRLCTYSFELLVHYLQVWQGFTGCGWTAMLKKSRGDRSWGFGGMLCCVFLMSALHGVMG